MLSHDFCERGSKMHLGFEIGSGVQSKALEGAKQGHGGFAKGSVE